MLSVDPKPLVEVRCSNQVQLKGGGGFYKCNRSLGVFEAIKGEIKCPRCKHMNKVEISTHKSWT